MPSKKMMQDPAIIAKLYRVLDIEDYFQRFDAFEELLRDWEYEV